MSKTGDDFQREGYATVAERIRLFYERHPGGRIVTELISRTDRDVVFKALVYRATTDAHPSATGWAAEREGDGDINVVACLENTETSAVGRALANLGFTAARERPSAEEMAKASRVRERLVRERMPATYRNTAEPAPAAPPPPRTSLTQERRNAVADLVALIARAERLGVRPSRAARWRAALDAGELTDDALLRCERRLRIWISRRSRLSPF